MIAVIKTGGKQYKVKEKDLLKVEKLDVKEGDEVVFDQVLLVSDDKESDVKIGDPVVKGAKVTAKVIKQGLATKIEVVHYKAKTREYTRKGHRQPFTQVEIASIA